MARLRAAAAFLFFFLILLVCVGALEVPSVCSNNCLGEESIIGTGISYASRTVAIGTPRSPALSADLDLDGVEEIFILHGSTLSLYHGSDLAAVNSFSGFPTNARWSNLVAFDIDGDSRKELIVGLFDPQQLFILKYNGTHFFKLANHSTTGTTGTSQGGEIAVVCGNRTKRSCVAISSDHNWQTSGRWLYGMAFNATSAKRNTRLYDSGVGGFSYCEPDVSAPQYADLDSDGQGEYIFSVGRLAQGTSSRIALLLSVGLNASGHPRIESQATQSIAPYSAGTAGCKASNQLLIGKTFSSPSVYDYQTGGTLEAVMAYNINTAEYNVEMWAGNLASSSRYPAIEDADGQIVGNVARAYCMPNSDGKDFVVMGVKSAGNIVDILCASAEKTYNWGFSSYSSMEFTGLAPWNVSGYPRGISMLTTAADIDSDGVSEVLTTFGAFDLDSSTCNFAADCTTAISWASPLAGTNASLSVLNPQGMPYADILAATNTNLWYFDDVYTNRAPTVSSYYVNPCLSSTWKVNTTVEVRAVFADEDGDDVASRAVLYCGSPYALNSSWTAYLPPGTTNSFGFVANRTVTGGSICIYGRDTSNASVTKILSMSGVASTGVSFNDCTTEADVIPPAGNVTPSNFSVEPALDNAVAGAVAEIDASLGVGGLVIWLLIMAIVAVAVFIGASRHPNMSMSVTGGIIGVVELILFIVGVKLGMIPVAVLVVLVVLALAVLAFVFRSHLPGGA